MGTRRLGRCLGVVVVLALAVGCGHNTDAYESLQNAMKSHITEQDGRPVESVSCTPHVHDTVREETAHLRCVVEVRRADPRSYHRRPELTGPRDVTSSRTPGLSRQCGSRPEKSSGATRFVNDLSGRGVRQHAPVRVGSGGRQSIFNPPRHNTSCRNRSEQQ